MLKKIANIVPTEILERKKQVEKGKAFIVSTVQEELTSDDIKRRLEHLNVKEEQLEMALKAIKKQIKTIQEDRKMLEECLQELKVEDGSEDNVE